MEVTFCSACLIPNTRPRITFTADGRCNACVYAETKASIDWKAREAEFHTEIEPFRSRDGRWDCVVPWSGGKDSSYVAHRLKFEFGLNPLLVTFTPLIPNEVGMKNRESMLQLGFDHHMARPNQKVARHLARRFFVERGNQKVAWDAGINAFPLQVAVALGIKLVFYAEHGETEYGGRVLHKDSGKIRDFTEVVEHLVGDDPHNWCDDVVTIRDIQPYLYPGSDEIKKVGVKALYFGHFFRWSMYQNYLYIKDKIPFETAPFGRTEGTFTNFDSLDDKTDSLYYYMQFVKFGFGRASRDASRMIQNGHMDRAYGLELARKYDDEFPAAYFQENLDYLGMSEEEFHRTVDMHRNSELWKQEDGRWQLLHPPR